MRPAARRCASLREFVAADAFGHFSRGGLRKAFIHARKAEIKASPATRATLESMRPYDLRHSFGTAAYAATGDIRATQLLMGHSRVEMTQRYTLGAVDARLTAAVQALDAAVPARKPKRLPPSVTTPTAQRIISAAPVFSTCIARMTVVISSHRRGAGAATSDRRD